MVKIILIISALLLVIVWINRRKLGSSALRKKILLYSLLAALIGLAISGKLNWLLTGAGLILGFLWLLIQKSLFIFQSAPFAGPLLFRFIFRHTKNKADFSSDWIRVFIHRPSGAIDGEVLRGEYRNRRLSSLQRHDLDKLLEVLRSQDRKGFLLLQSYLLMRFRQSFQRQDANRQQAAMGEMSKEEALRILGLDDGADEEAIKTAHKQLMQKLHPDRGGSSYLSAKINEARDFLLKK